MAAVRCAPPRRLRAFLGAPSAALAVAHPEAAEALRAHVGLGIDPAAAGVLRVLPAALLHAPAGAGKHPNPNPDPNPNPNPNPNQARASTRSPRA